MPGFFLLLKSQIVVAHSEDTIFISISHVKILVSSWLLRWSANNKFQKWIKRVVFYLKISSVSLK